MSQFGTEVPGLPQPPKKRPPRRLPIGPKLPKHMGGGLKAAQHFGPKAPRKAGPRLPRGFKRTRISGVRTARAARGRFGRAAGRSVASRMVFALLLRKVKQALKPRKAKSDFRNHGFRGVKKRGLTGFAGR